MKTEIFVLRSNGTYRVASAQPEPQWANHLRDHSGRQAYSLFQKPEFPQNRIQRYRPMEEEADAPPRNQEKKRGKNMIVTEEGSIYPLSPLDASLTGPGDGFKVKDHKSLYQTAYQYAASNASSDDGQQRWQSMGFMALVALTVFLVMLMGFIATTQIYLNKGGDSNGGLEPEVSVGQTIPPK